MTAPLPLVRALLGAAFILGATALLNAMAPEHISPEWAQRLLGAMLGAVVVIYANSIPKAFTAMARSRRSAAQQQAAHRFSGWAMLLGGISYMLACLFAPLEHATLIGGALLALALCVSAVRHFRVGRQDAP